MIGVIARVDIDNNSGIVIDENKEQYPFSLSDCVGFESEPQIGEKVSFGLQGNEVFFVESLQKEHSTNLESPTIKKIQNTPTKKISVQINVNIRQDKSIEDCVKNYFSEVISTVSKYEAEFEEGELLDFLMIKRFLNTAYNNLKDIDSTFMDEYVLELREDLKVLEKVYQKFYKQIRHPALSYDFVFLKQQNTYQAYKKRIDLNSSELYTLESKIKGIEREIDELQKRQSKSDELKRYKTYYVDSIHRARNLKDENVELQKALGKFESKYKDEFTIYYTKEAKIYDSFIKEQLNGYAYEFDKKMWENAENSSAIRAFFKRANIEEEYSSKTFLKYFLKSLDNTKFSQEHKRLYNLLEYLENRAKMRVLIVDENMSEADSIQHLIRSFDKEYSVEKNDKPRSNYYRKDLARLDVVFVNYNIKSPTIKEFLNMMQKRLQQSNSKAKLCIFSHTFTKEALSFLKKEEIHDILVTNVTRDELRLNIKNILDGING